MSTYHELVAQANETGDNFFEYTNIDGETFSYERVNDSGVFRRSTSLSGGQNQAQNKKKTRNQRRRAKKKKQIQKANEIIKKGALPDKVTVNASRKTMYRCRRVKQGDQKRKPSAYNNYIKATTKGTKVTLQEAAAQWSKLSKAQKGQWI